MGLFSRKPAVEAIPCRWCGQLTSERDRQGQAAHRTCTTAAVARIGSEARRSTDPGDLAERVREQQRLAQVMVGELTTRAVELGSVLGELTATAVEQGIKARSESGAPTGLRLPW